MNQSDFYRAFTPVKVVIYQGIHSTYLIWRVFGARPQTFPPFKQVWSLFFLWSTLQHFWSVFLFSFLKWSSSLCQIYWIPDLQSLKLVCLIVPNTWKQKCADSKLFWTTWPCLSWVITCENTSTTGWGLLIFKNVKLTS